MADWHGVPGWFSDGDQQAYASLISAMPEGGSLLEVGSYVGRSLCSVAPEIRARHIQVTAVDLFVGGKQYAKGEYRLVDPLAMLQLFEANTVGAGLVDIEIIQSASAEAFIRLAAAGRRFDLIFLDADHTQAGVAADLAGARCVLRPETGVLAGHDYEPSSNSPIYGVVPAVHASLGTPRLFPRSKVWAWSSASSVA